MRSLLERLYDFKLQKQDLGNPETCTEDVVILALCNPFSNNLFWKKLN